MKRIFTIICITILIFINTTPVFAKGNEWVYDEPQVISEETENYIKNLNENLFVNYKNKPQLAFIVIKDLPCNIDTYKLDMFNEYGVGTAEENCGMLFVLAVNDRKYGLEIGDGFEKGSLLRKDLETDFISDEMKSALREEDYDTVVLEIAKHLEKLMADEENGIYIQKSQEAVNNVISLINSIGTVEYTTDCRNLINASRKAYDYLTEDQKEMVTNYEILEKAEDEYQELFDKITINGIITFFKSLIAAGVCILLGIVIFRIIDSLLKRRKTDKLCEKYEKLLGIAEITDLDDFKKWFCKRMSEYDIDISIMESEFLSFLHKRYLESQITKLKRMDYLQEPVSKYELRLKQNNDLNAFTGCSLIPLGEIINMIDEEENNKRELENLNIDIINKFFKENAHRITNPEITQALENKLKDRINSSYILEPDELERIFADSLKELSFKWEFEKFCDEHKNEIDSNRKDFNSSEFYRSIKATDNYRNYRSDGVFHNHWMLPLLMLHMSNQRKSRIEREEREERERIHREKMRREEAARRERQRMSSINSSFGGGFGGGRSSGGGFSGGW